MASANDIRLNLLAFCTGARTKTTTWRLDLTPDSEAPKIRFSNKQDMLNFVTELNLRFFKCWKTLNDYYNTILLPKILDFYTKHNADVVAYAAQVAAAGTLTSTSSSTTSSSGSSSTTVTVTTTTTNLVTMADPGEAYTGWIAPSPYSYHRWWGELSYVAHALVQSCLYWDGLYTGVLVMPTLNWKLPPYRFNHNVTTKGDAVVDSFLYPSTIWEKSGCDCYEDAWKTYYNNIIGLRTLGINTTSTTQGLRGKQMIDYIKQTVIPSMPRRFFVMPDNGNISNNYTPGYTVNALVLNNSTSTRDHGWMNKLSSYQAYYDMLKAIAEDIKDWTYNRWKNINLSDYVTKAKAALEEAKQFDDTGEFTKWLKDSGFKVQEKLPQNPRLVYLSGTGPDYYYTDYNTWVNNMKENPSSVGSPTENPFNMDIYCSTNDIIEGRVKATADEFVI